MKMRIVVFEDEIVIRKPISSFLRGKGHDVLDFPSPMACGLFSGKECACPRRHACADLVITDMKMPGMTGLELIRVMADRGCHVPPRNKIVISSFLTSGQRVELDALGCHFLPKPFRLDDLWQLVQACEKNIAPDRALTPIEELLKTISTDRAESEEGSAEAGNGPPRGPETGGCT